MQDFRGSGALIGGIRLLPAGPVLCVTIPREV